LLAGITYDLERMHGLLIEVAAQKTFNMEKGFMEVG
jgi:hypothetical protein